MKLNKKVATSMAAGAVVVAGSGVAYAFWTTTGGGSGQSTGASSNGTVSETATFDASTLAPGTSVTVTYGASNSSPTDLSVVAPTASVASDKGATCSSYLHLSAQPTGNVVVPGGTEANPGTASLGTATLSMDNAVDANSHPVNQDACKGQVITITLGS